MDKKTAMELYAIFRRENSIWLGNHREHSQQYFTLIIAILGASIAVFSQFIISNPFLTLIVIIGPLINILLCRVAVTMCNRSYQLYLENVSILSKLEPIIGLIDSRIQQKEKQTLSQFPKDKSFLPERWLQSRQFDTAKAFVEQGMNVGANKITRRTFAILGFTNGLVAISIAIYCLLIILGII